MARRN